MPNKAKKIYVIDTSVLLYSAASIRSFGSKEVVIPYVVLEELDKFKNRDGEVGRNARQVVRELNELRQQGKINEGVVVTPKGGKLRIELNFIEPLSPLLDLHKNDDRILNVCIGLKEKRTNVILVSKDINLAVRADLLGISAQDFDTDRTVQTVSDMYTGSAIVTIDDLIIDSFYAGQEVVPAEIGLNAWPNQYLTLVSSTDPNKTALARVVNEDEPLAKLKNIKNVWGIKPRSREQQFAMDAIMNPDIPLVSLSGFAGVGKTIISLACALQQVSDEGVYDRLIVTRPVQPMGRDIGFIPGDKMQKLDPWMGPIKDSIEYLTRHKDKGRNVYNEMIDLGMLEVEALTYIRGRSIPNTFFITDEAQDLTRQEIKTIVSRMGENSKLVLLGDVMQISNPYLDSTNNGLSNAIEKFKKYDVAAHVTLLKGERSLLSTIASEVL